MITDRDRVFVNNWGMFMKENIKKLLLVVLCGAALLTGCSKNNGSSPSEISVSSDGGSESTGFPATSCGVRLEKAPERVVSLSPAATEMICELGFKEKLVGISDYCDFPEGLTAKKVGSTENPDIDAILELKPDAVFTLSALSEREAYALKQADITVLTAEPPVSTEGYAALYSELAAAFYGNELTDDGVRISEQIGNTALLSLENTAKGVKLGSFVYVTEKLTVAGADTFEGAVLGLAGENMCKESGYVSPDNIGDPPEYIIADDSLSEHKLTADGTLNGFINGGAKVMFVDASLFERPSARTAMIFVQLLAD